MRYFKKDSIRDISVFFFRSFLGVVGMVIFAMLLFGIIPFYGQLPSPYWLVMTGAVPLVYVVLWEGLVESKLRDFIFPFERAWFTGFIRDDEKAFYPVMRERDG